MSVKIKQINLLENELERALYESHGYKEAAEGYRAQAERYKDQAEGYKAELNKYIALYGPLPPPTSRAGFQS